MSSRASRVYLPAAGFSLSELVLTLSVMGALVGLGFGAVQGARALAERQRARSELAALLAAVEAYRRDMGVYPAVNDCHALVGVLSGQLGPSGLASTRAGRDYLRASGLQPDAEGRLLDPWQQPYLYEPLRNPVTATVDGYRLYSSGPDGRGGVHTLSGPRPGDSDAADNVYAAR